MNQSQPQLLSGVDGLIMSVNEADLFLEFVEVVEESRLAGANVALNDHREGSPRRGRRDSRHCVAKILMMEQLCTLH